MYLLYSTKMSAYPMAGTVLRLFCIPLSWPGASASHELKIWGYGH